MTERTDPGEVSRGDERPPVRDGTALRSDGGGGSGDRLFDALPDPAVRYVLEDGEPRVTAVNPAYARAFDVDPSITGGLEPRLRADLGHGETENDHADGDALVELTDGASTADPDRTVLRADTPEGERDFLSRVVPLEHDEPDEGFLVLTDITAQRERTRELVEERDRLDEFASIVSHDLRNPLEVASIQLEAARNRGEDAHLEKVEDAHERMERIIDDVLTLARQGRVIDEAGDAALAKVAEAAWRSVSAPDATLRVEDDVELRADDDRLQELLENLFRNASEHAGPEVVVEVGRADDGFYVADDGEGIPEDVRDRVFEGGVSTTSNGTGLGLAIVERIAAAHGWSVEVTEADSDGARFEFGGVDVQS